MCEKCGVYDCLCHVWVKCEKCGETVHEDEFDWYEFECGDCVEKSNRKEYEDRYEE